MNRIFKLTTAAVLSAGLLAGCGGAKPQTPAAPGGTPAPAPAKEVTITYARPKDPTDATKQHLAAFAKAYPNIKVNYLEMPASSNTVHDDFVTKLSAGDTSVDVFGLDIVWAPEFGSAKWLLPLDQYVPKDEQDKFLPGPIAGDTYDGHLWAVPFWTDAGLLYYRKDILDQAGLQPPKTWDDIIKDSKQLIGKNGIETGLVWQGNQYEGLVCDALEFMYGNGGKVLDGKNVVVNSPNNVAAVKFMRQLVADGISPAGVTTYAEADALRPWLEGKSLFMRNWAYAWASSQNDPSSKVKDKVGVVPVPIGPNGTNPSATLGGWNLGINANIAADKKEAAVTLVKWLTGDEGQKINALVGGKLATRKALYQDADVLKANPHWKDFYQVFVNAQPRPVSPAYPKISDVMQINLHKAITGEITPEAAVKNMADQIAPIVK